MAIPVAAVTAALFAPLPYHSEQPQGQQSNQEVGDGLGTLPNHEPADMVSESSR